ncbi:MAG: GDSL-type esterase/lipase family protein [Candidatus Spyradosoma sp.]
MKIPAKNLVLKIAALAAFSAFPFFAQADAPDGLVPAEPYREATYPSPRNAGGKADRAWLARTKSFADAAKNLKDCRLVFVGDSITDNWRGPGKAAWNASFARFSPLNLGYSGDRTENVLFRLTYGENLPPNIRPRAFVLLIGTNNFGHRDDAPEDVAAGEIKIVELLRKARPDAHVVVMATFPRAGERFEKKIAAQNAAVAAWVAARGDEKISVLDINPKFAGADGKVDFALLPDGLHPNARGHEIWAAALLEKFAAEGIFRNSPAAEK